LPGLPLFLKKIININYIPHKSFLKISGNGGNLPARSSSSIWG
jgi:hypothetical protein